MRRNRYGVIGAIAAILILIKSGFVPALGHVPGLAPRLVPAMGHELIATLDQQAELGGAIFPLEPGQVSVAKHPPGRGDHLSQGRLAYQGGHFAEAAHHFYQAAQRSESFDRAQALSYLSLAQQQQGQWPAAQHSVSQSLELTQHLSNSRLQQLMLGRAWNTQGSLHFFQGNARAALEAWLQAETAYGAAKDETRRLGSLLNQSQALQSLGYYGRARRTLEEIQKRLDQEPADLQLIGLANLGKMYWRIGELKQSKTILLKAKKLAEDVQEQAQKSAILLSLGNTEQALESTDFAIQYYQQAASLGTGEVQFQATLNWFRLLVIYQRLDAAQDLIPVLLDQLGALPVSRTVLYGATNFADSLTQLAFPKSGRKHPVQELEIKESKVKQLLTKQPQVKALIQSNALQIGAGDGRALSWDAIAANSTLPPSSSKTSTARAQAQLAVETLSWVVKTADALEDIRASAYGQGYLGHIYELSQQWEIAQALTQQALAQTDRIQAKDIGYQWLWQLARIYQAQNQLEAAKVAYHKSFDILQSLRSDLVAAQPELQFSFREQVAPVYREFVDLLLRLNEKLPQGSQDREATLQLARRVLESLQIAELNNFFNAACIQDQVVALDEIERQDTAVLYPIILPDRLTVIWSLPGEPLRSETTVIDQGQVEAILRELRQNLELKFTSPEGKQAGEKVYNWLIQPIADTLKANQIKTLTFVLDGELQNVPMAALYDRGRKHYLVEDYSIALTPGLQLFEPKPLSIRQGKTLLAGVSEARNALSALPYVEEELNQIHELVPSEMLLNQAFTRETLERNVRTSVFSVVHLATHGKFSSDSEKTFISAWDERVNVTELSSILRGRVLSEPIELLVLSACETAGGDSRAALGLAGIAVQAGARSTIASLWNLDDESGARFMQEFYQALNQEMSRAEALREAQLVLLKNPNYRHPANWASYVLLGSWL